MSLAKKTVRNLSAVGLLHIFAKIINLVTLTILSRLLLPSDFGIIAIAGIMITVVDQFKDFGIATAVIQRHEKPEETLRTGFSIRFVLGIFLYSIIFMLAPIYANYFNEQVVNSVLKVSAIVLILENLRFMPDTKLRKELKFKTIVISNFFGYISYSVVAIFLAYSGYSFWSIVYARIIQTIISSIYFWIKSPWKFQLHVDKEIGKELISYGKYIFGTGFIVLAIDNMNFFVLGKLLGTTIVGYYFVAYSWATFSSREINGIVSRVLLPTYSSIKSDIPRVGSAYLRTVKYTAMISIPIAFGTFAIAPEFVNIVLGDKWNPSVLPLQILCIIGLLQPINSTTGSVYYSIGKARITTMMGGMQFLLMVLFVVPVAMEFGIIGVAILYSLIIIIITPINFSFLIKYLKFDKKKFFEILITPAISAVLMVIVILITKEIIKNFNIFVEYQFVNLILLILLGVIIYFVSLFILTKGKLKQDIMDLKKLF